MDEHSHLHLTHLNKTYAADQPPAVDNVSMQINNGELVTLLGPSGSGKTTLLNLISGFLAPDSGTIHVAGRNITYLPPEKRDIGVVFQNYALFPHMNVAQNIAFPLKQRRIGKAQRNRRIEHMLDLVGLTERAGAKPDALSGGQQQRVALARALVFEPDLLLLDEPLGALDKALRGKLQAEIRRLHQKVGKTFVFVTHDQDEALALSDRIAVFKQGKIEQFAPAKDIYERPETYFTASFLGESTILKGTRKPASTWLETTLGRHRLGPHLPSQQGKLCLMIRPEHTFVQVNESSLPEGFDQTDSLKAQVTDIVYQGSLRKIYLALANQQQALALEMAGHYSPVEVGNSVRFCWDMRKTWLVDAI